MPEQLNGDSHGAASQLQAHQVDTVKAEIDDLALDVSEPPPAATNGHKTPPQASEEFVSSHHGLKRKLVDSAASSLPHFKKPVSPPWKRFEAEGPTSFVAEGRRRSGRTNALPLELQPLSGKRQTRAAYNLSNDGKRHSNRHSSSSKPQASAASHPSPATSVNTNSNKQSSKPKPRSHTAPSHDPTKSTLPYRRSSVKAPTTTSPKSDERTIRRSSSLSDYAGSDSEDLDLSLPLSQSPAKPVKSIKLNFRRPPLPVLNPGNVSRRKFSSFQQFIEHTPNLADEGEGLFDRGQVRREALLIQRLENAALHDGVLNAPWWLSEDAPPEPVIPHAHQDYLTTHVEMFLKALKNERARHVKEAKTLAQAAAAAVAERWKQQLPQAPKTADDLAREEILRKRALLTPIIVELKNKWLAVAHLAKQRKLARFEQEQEALGKQALGEMLERSTKALEDRRKRFNAASANSMHLQLGSSQASADEMDENSLSDPNTSSASLDDYDDGDSSSSDSTEESVGTDANDDELSREELLKKYGNLPALPLQSPRSQEPSTLEDSISGSPALNEGSDHDMPDADQTYPELEDVAPELLDSENSKSNTDEEGTETSAETSAEDDDEEEDNNESSDASEEDQSGSLFQLLSAKSKKSLEQQIRVQNTDDLESMPDALALDSRSAPVASEPNSTSDAHSIRATPPTTVGSSPFIRELNTTTLENGEAQQQEPSPENTPKIKTAIPSLLRGQLREYQHHGLDWLAGMYDTDTNGILADEMGLGKTIQTIALLAHLATERQVWGPHLIVVPTSVMLNWEMEFKKWCPGFKILTYYGNVEERKAKRRGWTENSCHVCITSYELAVQDASALKRRNWHFLILDEAHNIKNFRSQRWQTLLNFKSEARLLLTGTPLQNNLSELWSLLFFLAPEADEDGKAQFSDLKTFTTSFKHPVEQILDHGREALDDEARAIVEKLHKVLRPHLLRRLKSEVEKQMPKKYEHIVKCRLSKRQRQLYDGFMGLSGTRESFASGNYMSIIACLMQLRKVCNHPDLFEERQIVTSFAMPKSAVAEFEIKELLIRKRLQDEQAEYTPALDLLNLWQPNVSSSEMTQIPILTAHQFLMDASQRQSNRIDRENFLTPQADFWSSLAALKLESEKQKLGDLQSIHHEAVVRAHRRPVLSFTMLERLKLDNIPNISGSFNKNDWTATDQYLNTSEALQNIMNLSPALSDFTNTAISKFGCITPAVVAPNLTKFTLTENGMNTIRILHPQVGPNSFHESQTRLSIAFPDKSLIQYDCGKLQQLDRLLRELTSGGHRALIFTQMTKVLNILEQFLNLHGYRYLRLDGATKVEQRQALTDQFNCDQRISVFILSSRSGGLGINLTGADTVIFYDLDWNPAMDKQCQDRCHRIGQTRDVHIYRFISEGTIEANILRKSNQKRMLDDVVIQEGEFTTDVFNRELADELDADADAALDMVIGGGDGSAHGNRQNERALANVEDKEDHDAAMLAHKEYVHTDDADFKDKDKATSVGTGANTPDLKTYDSPRATSNVDDSRVGTAPVEEREEVEAEDDEQGSYEEYMLRFMEWDIRDLVIKPLNKGQKKSKKGKDQGIRIRR